MLHFVKKVDLTFLTVTPPPVVMPVPRRPGETEATDGAVLTPSPASRRFGIQRQPWMMNETNGGTPILYTTESDEDARIFAEGQAQAHPGESFGVFSLTTVHEAILPEDLQVVEKRVTAQGELIVQGQS